MLGKNLEETLAYKARELDLDLQGPFQEGWPGIYYAPTSNEECVVAFLTLAAGYSYDNRGATIHLIEQVSKQTPNRVRLELAAVTRGTGRGAIDIRAIVAHSGIKLSKLQAILYQGREEEVLPYTDVGSVGLVQAGTSKVVRPVIYNHPHIVAHYSLQKTGMYTYLIVSVMAWRVDTLYLEHLCREMFGGVTLPKDTYSEFKWIEADYTKPGYAGKSISD